MKCLNCDGEGQILKEYSDDEVEEYITELYGTFRIGYIEFDAGRILRELDPIAFQCAHDDLEEYKDCEECNGTGEVEDE